jgi:hypothetical protein
MKSQDALLVLIIVELVKRLQQSAHHATQENIVPLKVSVPLQVFAKPVSSVVEMQLRKPLR